MPLINTRGAASIKGFGFAGFSPTVPGMPTSVSAAATSCSAISVSFTAPACNGGLSIDYYQAVCTSTGTNSATGSSSPISVTGLSGSTSYTFKVRAHNSLGYGSYSSSTGTATTNAARGCASYTSAGTFSWVAPSGVTSVSAVAIGAGAGGQYGVGYFINCCCFFSAGGRGGGGGGTGYRNNISITPGSSYTVTAGTTRPYVCGASGYSIFKDTSTVYGGGANQYYPGCHLAAATCLGGTCGGYGGYNGSGRTSTNMHNGSGGGGAGGYSNVGTVNYSGGGQGGGTTHVGTYDSGQGGCVGYLGSAGGGASADLDLIHSNTNTQGGAGGGGVGLYGRTTGTANGGSNNGYSIPTGGSGGSGGGNGSTPTFFYTGGSAGSYGGGGGGGSYNPNYSGSYSGGSGASGAVRIVWPGTTRKFPTTCVS